MTLVREEIPFSIVCRAMRGKSANLRAIMTGCGPSPARNCCLWGMSLPEDARKVNHDASLDWHLLEGALTGTREGFSVWCAISTISPP